MTNHVTPLNTYRQSKKRLFLLDYDGTLVGFNPIPSRAKPTAALKQLLKSLAGDEHNTVVVISGRDQKTLDEWLGDLDLSLVAEHGTYVRESGGQWRATVEISDGWKNDVLPVMRASTSLFPGTLVEEKASALVWHYRNSKEQSDAGAEARHLTRKLQPYARQHGLSIIPGSKIVEVRPTGADKGKAAVTWLGRKNWDFVLAAGDDTTDEDLFRALPKPAFTIKIGPGDTKADARLANPHEFLELLESLTKS